MKKYYLVAENSYCIANKPHWDVFVTDNSRGYKVLFEFEAQSYLEAVKMFSFRVSSAGRQGYLSVAQSGKIICNDGT